MKKETNKSDWKSLVQGFVGDILARISDDVSKRVHIFITQLKRRTAGAILLLVGCIFLLIGLVIFLNALTGNEFPWLGYSVVGFVAVIGGYALVKE